jgi:glycosyltransferase involved in cell wall biosynthesis
MKTVLIIAYTFPPFSDPAEGSGAQRPLKFAKYLRAFGWEPVILSVDRAEHGVFGHDLLAQLPGEMKIYRTKPPARFKFRKRSCDRPAVLDRQIQQSHAKTLKRYIATFKSYLVLIYGKFILNKFLSPIYYNVFVPWFYTLPDDAVFWLRPALKKALEIVEKEAVDLVFTTSAPYTAHLVGYVLKRKTRKPWIADFRDEWSKNPFRKYPTWIHAKINAKLEKKVLSFADRVISISPRTTEEFRRILDRDAEKFITITNGFDPEDIEKRRNSTFANAAFNITYLGVFISGYRTPDKFIRALETLVSRSLLNSSELRVTFVGERPGINNSLLKGIVEEIGYQSHESALEYMFKATILLLLESPEQKTYPGKLFEYISTGKPILAVVPPNSQSGELLRRINLGAVADCEDIDEIAHAILHLYNKWKMGELHVEPDWKEINRYERRNLTKALAEVFNGLHKPLVVLPCECH